MPLGASGMGSLGKLGLPYATTPVENGDRTASGGLANNLFDLDNVFSARKKVVRMNSIQIREALNLRARVNDLSESDELELDYKIGQIVRDARGNIGQAMTEYCRYSNDSYKPHVKSQEFRRLVNRHRTILKFICSYHHCSINLMSKSLSELDFRDTMKSIDYLVGQKILIRPKKGHIAINPYLIHNVEHTIMKRKK